MPVMALIPETSASANSAIPAGRGSLYTEKILNASGRKIFAVFQRDVIKTKNPSEKSVDLLDEVSVY